MGRMPFLGFMRTREERRYARRESTNALAIYHSVRALHPELAGIALYETIVVKLAGVDSENAQALVRAAAQSSLGWPSVRELTLRDVVHYVCFTGFTRTHNDRGWTRTSLREVVDSVIPGDL